MKRIYFPEIPTAEQGQTMREINHFGIRKHLRRRLCNVFLISFCFFFAANVQAQTTAQQYTIRGTVLDDASRDTLIGATVLVKGTQKGIFTDVSGKYQLSLAPGNYMLVFSYTGYETKEISFSLKEDQILNISIKQVITSFEEVTVTGQRKFFGNMEYGREIPTISAKTIEKLGSSNASDLLHANISGVWATKTSGSPGDHQKIRIRGQSSFFSSAEPLYVVDGVPVPIVNMSSLGISDLNTHDIDNITILKDISSTALYGFQGGNGVILIDTKKGRKNEINFSTRFGCQWFDNFYDLMNTRDFLTTLDNAYNKIRAGMHGYYPLLTDTTVSDDNWQREIFRTGFTNEYQLSASGTAKKVNYYLSGNYTRQTGVLPDVSYQRYTFSSRFGRTFWKKLFIDAGYRFSRQDNKNNQDIYNGNPLLFAGITKSPCLRNTPDSLIYERPNKVWPRIFYIYHDLNNPELLQGIIDKNYHSLGITSHVVSGSARLQLTEHLSLNAMESLMLRHSGYNYHADDVTVKSNEDVFLYNHQYNISYNNTFGIHKVDMVAAYRFYKDNLWWKVDTLQGELNSYSYLRNSMAAYGITGSVQRSIGSYVANASYSLNETFFLSAVANLSRIREGLHIDYYSLFPSLAFSVDLSKFLPRNSEMWINNFSLYTNWGKSGNYPLNGLANDLYEKVIYTYGSTTSTYPGVTQLSNHFLQHESSEETDFGIKTSFFDNRFSINASYYAKDIRDLIIQRQIPYYYGGGMQYTNVGAIQVKGAELDLEAIPVETKNFSWQMKFNIAGSHQMVKKVMDDKPMVFADDNDLLMPRFIIEEGKTIGDIYGYKIIGKWSADDDKARDKNYVLKGGMKYLNADSSDKKLSVNDMVVIGNSVPDFTCNFANSFQYKQFSLDLLWYAVFGVEKFNETRAATIMTGVNRDVNHYINDSIPTLYSQTFYQSSEFIDDASFIRLKSVTVGYEPIKKIFNVAKVRFSVSFENLITITKYRGYDPESTTFTDNNFSDNAIDRGSVPNPKGVYLTIGVKF
jgi:TonB-dependent starch-binding outer membrane protein SusC